MQWLVGTNIDFLGKKFIFLSISVGLIIIGAIYLSLYGLNYGIDFAGGTMLRVRFVNPPGVGEIRKKIEALNLGDTVIQTFGDNHELLIRVENVARKEAAGSEKTVALIVNALRNKEDKLRENEGKLDLNEVGAAIIGKKLAEIDPLNKGDETLYQKIGRKIINFRKTNNGVITSFEDLKKVEGVTEPVISALKDHFYLGSFTVTNTEMVGPKVGADLRKKAISALTLALIGMLIYITLRFQFYFAVGAIIALAHDAFISASLFAMSGGEFNLPIIAALLTVVGYSINDTIVVYDRIRDNMRLMRKDPLEKIMNRSINQTLSRTILTSFTTFIVVLALYLFGSETIKGFALVLIIGIIVGTYSSIYIASPIALFLNRIREKKAKKKRR
ncbi:MAG: protein translocase subunit SecF [Acidobacteria bacterium]|nr:protein translocase subunit SecF [Acidobacteriota bacterium]